MSWPRKNVTEQKITGCTQWLNNKLRSSTYIFKKKSALFIHWFKEILASRSEKLSRLETGKNLLETRVKHTFL